MRPPSLPRAVRVPVPVRVCVCVGTSINLLLAQGFKVSQMWEMGWPLRSLLGLSFYSCRNLSEPFIAPCRHLVPSSSFSAFGQALVCPTGVAGLGNCDVTEVQLFSAEAQGEGFSHCRLWIRSNNYRALWAGLFQGPVTKVKWWHCCPVGLSEGPQAQSAPLVAARPLLFTAAVVLWFLWGRKDGSGMFLRAPTILLK